MFNVHDLSLELFIELNLVNLSYVLLDHFDGIFEPLKHTGGQLFFS